jgi:hypothetical protein
VRPAEQLGGVVDERGGDLAGPEGRVQDQVVDERNVGAHAADAEFAQGAVHALDGLREGGRPGRDLDQQGVVVGRDDRAVVGGAPVEAHPEASRGAVGGDAAVVGDEPVLRILGGDAALNGEAAGLDLVLGRDGQVGVVEPQALGEQDLRADDIHPRHHFRHRVFHLHARVDLDEIKLAGVRVDQKLHRARAQIIHFAHQFDRRLAQADPHLGIEGGGGGDFHHLLVAPLHRAVAFPQMAHLAPAIAQDLHLDVAGAPDVVLQENRGIAEGAARLAHGLLQLGFELGRMLHHPHAATTPAETRLEDEGIADIRRHLLQARPRGDRLVGARNGGHAGFQGDAFGGQLVAEGGQHVRRWGR